VLLTCYNRPLGDHLKAELSDCPGATAQGFHALGLHLVAKAGLVVPPNAPAEWFQTDLPEMLPVAAERLELSFDAIVVDEGQDFTPEWFTALQLLLTDPDDGPVYVFADENQAIYVDGWESPFEGEPFPLDLNCRNTLPIAEKVAAVIGAEPQSLGADGMPPQFIVAEGQDQILVVLNKAVAGMLEDEGVKPEQITILSDHRALADELQGSVLGGASVGDLRSQGLVAETIHRFKGLENDVVIVALDEVETDQQRALAYIGMSRAKGLLVVVGSSSVKTAIGW
jgi:superfamily I DNA and RNA helicase